jgi:phospholipase C
MSNGIQHVFVLMLENRSFDHMLGFSGINGGDASSGAPTRIDGLSPLGLRSAVDSFQTNSLGGIVKKTGGNWPPPPSVSVRALLTSNAFNGHIYGVTQGGDYTMPVDPAHEFCRDVANGVPAGVLQQLCGPDGAYPFGGTYPAILNSGYVASYAASGGETSPGEVMKCYSPSQFAVCDNWHASLPGPTWPNRFFVHAGSSGGLDHSPSTGDIALWDSVSGFSFPNGAIFDRLNSSGLPWRLYAGDNFPIVGALKGINFTDIHDYSDFASDVSQASYAPAYTFIEPSYGHLWSDFKCGTSQHPLDDVTRGEGLIKATYEAVRNSPLWRSSLSIITWDEHGGFFDHVAPPPAVAPGDTAPGSAYNQYGFTFQQYGPRVPAVVISPLSPRNLVDHRLYDHASIPATLEACFGLSPMAQRDTDANHLMPLVSLVNPRGDAPLTLCPPAQSGITACDPIAFERLAAAPSSRATPMLPVSRPLDSFDEGNMPGFLFVALRFDLALAVPGQRAAIRARFNTIQTRADASQYMDEVQTKVLAARNAI